MITRSSFLGAKVVLGITMLFCAGCNGETQILTELTTNVPPMTATATAIPSDTSTPTVTQTPTETPTPTIALPVLVDTPLPVVKEIISPENASRVVQVARVGNGFISAYGVAKEKDLIAFSSLTEVNILDMQTLGLVSHIETGNGINNVELSPDGKILAATHGITITLWDIASGNQVMTLTGHVEGYGWIGFTPDSQLFAAVTQDNSIKVWDVGTWEENFTLSGHTDAINDCTFSPDGKILASGSKDKSIKLWDLSNGKELITLNGHQDSVTLLKFSPDGQMLASGSDDLLIILWDVINGKKLKILSRAQYEIYDIDFSPDSKKLAFTYGYKASLWEIPDGNQLKEFEYKQTNSKLIDITKRFTNYRFFFNYNISDVDFSPDSSTLILATGEGVKYWNITDKNEVTINKITDVSNLLIFTKDRNKLITMAENETISLWDINTGQEISKTNFYNPELLSFAISPDGQKAIFGNSLGDIGYWNTQTNQGNFLPYSHAGEVRGLSFSPDGEIIGSAGLDWTVRIFDSVNNIEKYVLVSSPNDAWYDISFSPDGTLLASSSTNNSIIIWEVESGKRLRTLGGFKSDVGSVSFSPDGQMLAGGSKDKSIRIWNVSDWQLEKTIENEDQVNDIAFSPDSKVLASALENNSIKLWDVSSGNELTTLNGHKKAVFRLAFSPNGNILASSSIDNAIKLWSTENGTEITTLVGHNGLIWGIGFLPNGTALLSISGDGTLRMWGIFP